MSLKIVLSLSLALGCHASFASSALGQCGTQYRLVKEKHIKKLESRYPELYQPLEKIVKQTNTVGVTGGYFGAWTKDVDATFMQGVSGQHYLALSLTPVFRNPKNKFRHRVEDPMVLIPEDGRSEVELYPIADGLLIYKISEEQLAMLFKEEVAAVHFYVLYFGDRDGEAAGKQVERDAQGRDYLNFKIKRGYRRKIMSRLAGCIAGVKRSQL